LTAEAKQLLYLVSGTRQCLAQLCGIDLGRHIRPAGHRRPLIRFGGLMDAFFCPAEAAILSSDVAWEVATENLKGYGNE